jgi:DNA-binding ferritin-like protein (Dps family)
MNEILEFFEKAELAGKNITTVMSPVTYGGETSNDTEIRTVAYEARQLKALYLKLFG